MLGDDDANGRNNAVVTGQVKPLSNQDIKDLATYFNSLPKSLVLRRQVLLILLPKPC